MGTRVVGSVLGACAVALALLLPAAPARADRHTGDAGGGGSRSGRSDIWGGSLLASWVPGWPCRATPPAGRACDLSLAGEWNLASGDHEGGTLTQWSLQAGPRLMIYPSERFQPFVEALSGFTVEKLHGMSETSFSVSLGGGADLPISSRAYPVWVVRAQLSWNWIQNDRSDDSYWKVGIGLLYRFGERDERRRTGR